METLIKRKYIRKTNEKDGRELIIWNKIGTRIEEAVVGNYKLVVENISRCKFSWEVWCNSEIVEMGDINGDQNTFKRAKDKAIYQMTKHKKSLIRKNINHAL